MKKSRRGFLAFLGIAPVVGVVAAKAETTEYVEVRPVRGEVRSFFDHYETQKVNTRGEHVSLDNYGQHIYADNLASVAIAVMALKVFDGKQWVLLDSPKGQEIIRMLGSPSH